MFLGLAHFNNNRILLAKQRVEQEVQKRQETLNMTAQDVVAKLTELSGDLDFQIILLERLKDSLNVVCSFAILNKF